MGIETWVCKTWVLRPRPGYRDPQTWVSRPAGPTRAEMRPDVKSHEKNAASCFFERNLNFTLNFNLTKGGRSAIRRDRPPPADAVCQN